MKSSSFIFAFAWLGCTVLAAPARADDAQSSVTIYGVLDMSITSQDSGAPGADRDTLLTSGLWTTSRLGFRGNEQLGGGLSALFNLEAGLDPTSDSPNPDFFNRRAVIGLTGHWGQLTIGREYTPLNDVAGATDPLQQSFYGSTLDAFAGDRLTRRLSNAARYDSPTLGGFKAIASASAGEGQGPRTWSLASSWTGGPLYLGAAYLDLRGQDVNARQYVVGVRYDIGGLQLATNYLAADRTDPAPRYSQWNIGLNHRFGPNQVFANVQTNRLEGGARGTTLSLAYAYYLSKRTQLYATVAVLRNNDQAVFGLGSASTPPASAPGSDPSALALGIQHSF